jgi:catechol 2,3-dioxygenase-like lactoylglutathione lyase family enzyme
VDLYAIEFVVANWPASLVWYREVLGLPVLITDEPNRYALLAAGPARVAVKAGSPAAGSTKAIFRVKNLQSELARLAEHGVVPTRVDEVNAEGYRSARLFDPDGHRIDLFEWDKSHSSSPDSP